MITLRNGGGIQWPDDKRIAVMLTFDFDAEYLRYSVIGKQTIGFADRSRGEYGPHTGIYRCLDMLERQHVPATFFIPGKIIEEYPKQVQMIADAGYEIAYHGYDHDNTVGIPEVRERENIRKSKALIEKICGRRPVGSRGPLDVLQEYSGQLLASEGFLYDSTLKDCDWPYLTPSGLVELPLDVAQDDFSFFYFSYADEAPINCSYLPEEVRIFWQDAYDELAAEGDKIFVLKLHPQLIGRPGRIRMLEQFITYMKQSGAWIVSCAEAASFVKAFYEKGGDGSEGTMA